MNGEREEFIKKIIQGTGLTKDSIQWMVQEKMEELNHQISEEGALFIIAKGLKDNIRDDGFFTDPVIKELKKLVSLKERLNEENYVVHSGLLGYNRPYLVDAIKTTYYATMGSFNGSKLDYVDGIEEITDYKIKKDPYNNYYYCVGKKGEEYLFSRIYMDQALRVLHEPKVFFYQSIYVIIIKGKEYVSITAEHLEDIDYDDYIEIEIKSTFKVNDYITLVLENDESVIYLNGERLDLCLSPLLYSSVNEVEFDSPKTEFQSHCLNLKAWADNKYDIHLLRYDIVYPLLIKLFRAGDLVAKRALNPFLNDKKRLEIIPLKLEGSETFELGPEGELMKIKSLKYHQRVFDLLRIPPIISRVILERIENKEKEMGISFPESVKELYSVAGAEELLSIDPIERFAINEFGMIEFQHDPQGTCFSYFTLAQKSDPLVIMTYGSISNNGDIVTDFKMILFSEFIFSDLLRNYLMNAPTIQFISKTLKDDDLDKLRKKFTDVIDYIHSTNSFFFMNKKISQFIQISKYEDFQWKMKAFTQNDFEELLITVFRCNIDFKSIKIEIFHFNDDLDFIARKATRNLKEKLPLLKEALSKALSEPIKVRIIITGDDFSSKSIYKYFVSLTNYIDFVKLHRYIAWWENKSLKKLRKTNDDPFLIDLRCELKREINGVMIVFDLTQKFSESNIEKYVKLIREERPSVPILIVGNTEKELEQAKDDDEMVFTFIRGFKSMDYIKTSTKTGENVEKAFELLISKINEFSNSPT